MFKVCYLPWQMRAEDEGHLTAAPLEKASRQLCPGRGRKQWVVFTLLPGGTSGSGGGGGYTSVLLCLSGGGRPRTSALLCPLFLVGELGSSAGVQAFRQIC